MIYRLPLGECDPETTDSSKLTNISIYRGWAAAFVGARALVALDGRVPMYDFIVGMLLGSLLTIVPLLVWDRIARSRAVQSPPAEREFAWQPRRGNSTPQP